MVNPSITLASLGISPGQGYSTYRSDGDGKTDFMGIGQYFRKNRAYAKKVKDEIQKLRRASDQSSSDFE